MEPARLHAGGRNANEKTAELDTTRTPPQSIEAEQALLGALLLRNDAFDSVSDFLRAEHFYDPVHARIFSAIAKLITRGHIANPVTLKAYFENDGSFAEIGGAAYVARLAAAATQIVNVVHYGRLIRDLAARRTLIAIGEEMVITSYNGEIDLTPAEQIEKAEQSLYRLAETGSYQGGFRSFDEASVGAMTMAASAYHRDGGISGVSTGFRDLDKILGGLQRSDLIVLAGRPAMGKTALGTNIAFHAAMTRARAQRDWNGEGDPPDDGAVVAFFSLEMSAEQLATRVLAERASVPSERIRRGQIQDHEYMALAEASREIEAIPLYIDDTGALSIASLAARARRLKRQNGLGLIVVDYLQLITPSGQKRSDNRVQEVTEITQGLKALAKELDVPVLALAQLSRQVEQRDDKRPQLADLRESGSIEQDADAVLFVYREEYYLGRREPKPGTEEYPKWQEEMDKVHGLAEIIIGKHRHGPTGIAKLQFKAELTRFGDFISDDRLPDVKF
jgi:replicative DNA helicase